MALFLFGDSHSLLNVSYYVIKCSNGITVKIHDKPSKDSNFAFPPFAPSLAYEEFSSVFELHVIIG